MNGSQLVRRLVLGLALVLLVTGYGLTRWADAQMAAVANAKSDALQVWMGEKAKTADVMNAPGFIPSRTMYLFGVAGMGLGALVAVLTLPRGYG